MGQTNTKYFCELCISEGHDIMDKLWFDLSNKHSIDHNIEPGSVFKVFFFFQLLIWPHIETHLHIFLSPHPVFHWSPQLCCSLWQPCCSVDQAWQLGWSLGSIPSLWKTLKPRVSRGLPAPTLLNSPLWKAWFHQPESHPSPSLPPFLKIKC